MRLKAISGIIMTLLFICVLPLAFKAQPVAADAVDWWPMRGHDLNHTGYSTSTAPNTNNTIWNYTIWSVTGAQVYSSPAVVDGNVYVGSFDFKVYAFGDIRDVAVIAVTTSKTGCVPMPTVGQGFPANVTVTVENQGAYTETFNVTAFANSSAIGEQQVTLNPGENKTLKFIWDTTGFSYGDYTIKAVADTVPGETDTIDNTYIDGVVRVVIPGDINGDGIVDIYDAMLLALRFGVLIVDRKWNPNADINGNAIIDIYDAIILAGHFGKES